MDNNFRIGDQVKFIDEVGGGKIIDLLDNNIAVVHSDTGFDEKHQLQSLVKVNEETNTSYAYRNIPLNTDVKKQDSPKKGTKKNVPNGPVWEVDLHIENLIPNYKNLRNYDIVQHQLRYCQQTIERAILRNVYKLVIIHGKGQGVLREEVHILLRRYKVEFKDSIFEKHGGGATDVYFYN
jgi:dsDNA-specific endonuclease/ATPase MutS2